MFVLVACEFSGVVRDAFIDRGHEAISCDFEPGEGKYKDRHYQGDMFDLVSLGFNLMIAHQRIHNLAPSPTRWKERSRTYPGIAAAMADQWGIF